MSVVDPGMSQSHKQGIGLHIATEPNGGPGCPHSQEASFVPTTLWSHQAKFCATPPNAFMVGHVGQRPEDDGHWYEKAIPSLENPWP